MKKRLFISMHYMEIGGAEISLIGLLQAIDYFRYDVDLFIHSHQGELMQFIPKEVNLLPEVKSFAYIERPMVDALRHGEWKVVYGRLKAKWQFRQYQKQKNPKDGSAILQYVARNVEPYLPDLYKYGEYELAISFLHPHNYVLSKVHAKKKICWIHTDYSTIDVDEELERPIWSAYNHIMSISPEASKAFLKIFPSVAPKVTVMENILSPAFVRGRSELVAQSDVEKEFNEYEDEKVVRILSVGRFSEAKNYDNVPEICKFVNDNLNHNHNADLSVKWYIIGWGGDEPLIRKKIAEAGMEKNAIILGKRSNPYPYIKACDIYVQPSRYEGKSVTVREAQMLCKPVVVTNYPTASSQIVDGVDGRIVPLDNEGCAKGLAEFIFDKELQNKIVVHLQTHDYGNEAEIEKLYQLVP